MPPKDDPAQVRKLFYRIGEVSKLLEVEPSAIRHWETEFPGLRPGRSKKGQRVYSQADLRRLQEIKRLRYEQGYTIRGTRQVLRAKGIELREADDPLVVDNERLRESLLRLRARIQEFLDDLEQERDPQ